MSIISLKWFGGMAPRRGEQHLAAPNATEAENTNLYSGELRPLIKPALSHIFCRPGDDCFYGPQEPEDNCPEMPPCPIGGVPVEITTQPQAQSAGSGSEVTFTVEVNADATAPVSYQWQRSGVAIPGEVGATLTFTAAIEDNLQTYSVIVSNPCAVCFSSERAPLEVYEGYRCNSFESVALGISPEVYIPCDDLVSPSSTIENIGTSGLDATLQGSVSNTLGFWPGDGYLMDTCDQRALKIDTSANPNQQVRYGNAYGQPLALGRSGTMGGVFATGRSGTINKRRLGDFSIRRDEGSGAANMLNWYFSPDYWNDGGGSGVEINYSRYYLTGEDWSNGTTGTKRVYNKPVRTSTEPILFIMRYGPQWFELYVNNERYIRVSGVPGDEGYVGSEFYLNTDKDAGPSSSLYRMTSQSAGSTGTDNWQQHLFFYNRELSTEELTELYQAYLRNFEDFSQ